MIYKGKLFHHVDTRITQCQDAKRTKLTTINMGIRIQIHKFHICTIVQKTNVNLLQKLITYIFLDGFLNYYYYHENKNLTASFTCICMTMMMSDIFLSSSWPKDRDYPQTCGMYYNVKRNEDKESNEKVNITCGHHPNVWYLVHAHKIHDDTRSKPTLTQN